MEENLKPAARRLAKNAPQAAKQFNEEVLCPNAEGIAAEVCIPSPSTVLQVVTCSMHLNDLERPKVAERTSF